MLPFLFALALTATNPLVVPASFGPMPRPIVVVISATGVGYPPRHMRGPQARLMAHRAAEVTAVRNLSAKLNLPPRARVGSFQYVSAKNLPGGAVEVTVETLATARPVTRGGR